MSQVLVLLGSESDLVCTEDGIELLKELKIPFSLNIVCAMRAPGQVRDLAKKHQDNGGSVILCAGESANFIAGVVASETTLPILSAPTEMDTGDTSVVVGVPIASLGFGVDGFSNAAMLASQILAVSDSKLALNLKQDRQSRASQVLETNEEHKMEFQV